MSAPIGDGHGTRAGCRLGVYLAALSTLLVLVVVAVGLVGLAAATRREPQPIISTRSTP